MRNIVGPRVREARRTRGSKLTQGELAARLQLRGVDVDRTAITKIERQQRSVSDIELATLSDALGVSTSWLLGETNDPQRVE